MKNILKLFSLLTLVTVSAPILAHYRHCHRIENRWDREECYRHRGLVGDAWAPVDGAWHGLFGE